jgi:hypothetical protein
MLAVTISYALSGAFNLARTPDRLLLAALYGTQLAVFLKAVVALKALYVRARSGQPQSRYAYNIRWRVVRFAAVECGLVLGLIHVVQHRGWLYNVTAWIELHLRSYVSANWSHVLSVLLSSLIGGIVGNASYDLLRRLLPFGKTETARFTTRHDSKDKGAIEQRKLHS